MALRADDVDLDRDRVLVRRFQAGDDDAFDELYRLYHERLQRFCLKRVGDEHTAEEVAQEAFTRALTALPELGGELRFYPWVSVIAARLCVDCHRRQSRSEPAADPEASLVGGGEEAMVDAVDASLVVAALARLAPRHQDVLHLREVEGWSYQRIADHYGVKVGTVETLLFRARRALRREFHLVEGAGLAALPLFGRVFQWAGRARSRIPAWVPSAPSPTTLAAAATATAAAVALAVGPIGAPIRAHQAAPAQQAPAAARVRGAPAGGSVQGVTIDGPSAAAAATESSASTPASPSVAQIQMGPQPVPVAGGGAEGPVAATPTTQPGGMGPTEGPAPDTAAGPTSGPALPVAPPITVPSLDGVMGATTSLPVPPVAPLTPPTLDLGTVPGSILGVAPAPFSQVVGGLLFGRH